VGVCLAELQSLEYGEVRAQYRLRVAQSLVVAVDSTSDAIEITDENHHTQVCSVTSSTVYCRPDMDANIGRE